MERPDFDGSNISPMPVQGEVSGGDPGWLAKAALAYWRHKNRTMGRKKVEGHRLVTQINGEEIAASSLVVRGKSLAGNFKVRVKEEVKEELSEHLIRDLAIAGMTVAGLIAATRALQHRKKRG